MKHAAAATGSPSPGSLESFDARALTPREQHDLGAPRELPCARPSSAEEVAECLRSFPRSGLVPIAGGTGLCLGRPPRPLDALLDTSGLEGILEYSPADFVVTVRAGTRLCDLQSHVARHEQWLPVDPPDRASARIGGLIAGAATSALSASLGTMRRHLLGVRVAHSDGRLTRAGGRVVKNVSGYDVMKLHHGSLGSLGVLVEATLRLRPLPAADQLWCVPAASIAEAGAMLPVLRSTLTADPAALHLVGGLHRGEASLLIRLQGARPAVESEGERLRRVLPGFDRVVEPVDVPTGGPEPPAPLRTLLGILSRGEDPDHLHASLHCRPSQLDAALLWCRALLQKAPYSPDCAVDVQRGVVWLKQRLFDLPEVLPKLGELRERLARLGATLVIHDLPENGREQIDGIAEHRVLRSLRARLEEALDPRGILSPGRRASPDDA